MLRAVGLWQESARHRQLTWCLGWLTPASQPAPPWTPSISYTTLMPTASPIRRGELPEPKPIDTHSFSQALGAPSFLISDLGRPAGSIMLGPPSAIADHLLPPSPLGHLADHLHSCPSALHSLWADPGGCPLLWLPGSPSSASFFLTLPLFLSFLCLLPSIGASNHRYP